MNYLEKFNEVMKNAPAIALATTTNGMPDVRIVSHCIIPDRPDVIYFSTNRTSPKVSEFDAKNEIAFTTIPAPADGHVHVRSKKATVHKSDFTINDLKDIFLAQIPGFDKILSVIGAYTDVYEIHIKEATVVLNPMQTGTVTF
ncbi:MAG: pyridoxamine 5'-phosphate oxidase family protein [Mobilitalea sp.]